MTTVKTTRLKKQGNAFEIEIPKEFITKLDWRDGHILEINEEDNKLVIEKLHGFMGS
jgi:antitoxin component of MazEF toxin-antitoxin module